MKNMKKNLTWKLKEMPTGGELADLVETGVITKEEAREIMFGTTENDKEKIKALEEQLEFLRSLVTELSKNRTVSHITWSYPNPIRYYNSVYWDKTNTVLCNAGMNLESFSTTSGGSGPYSPNEDNSTGSIMTVSSMVKNIS